MLFLHVVKKGRFRNGNIEKMRKSIIFLFLVLMCVTVSFGQTTSSKKVWKTPVKGTRYLDELIKYDAKGRKIEEIEYTATGMKARWTYEYDENDRVVREVVYDDRNKPFRIHKIEYNPDGTKKRQLNYNAKGYLLSVKEYEYIRK